MTDYSDPINIYDYKYRRPIYFTNPFPIRKTNLLAKLVLDEDNFNFDLANEDGSDFRLMEYWNGVGVLKVWIAHWSKTYKQATLFFNIPSIGANASVTFTAYWGYPNAVNISDPASMSFLFYEDFATVPLSSSKWSGKLNSTKTDYGYLLPSADSFITITDPLTGKTNWTIEAGVYANFPAGVYHWDNSAMGFSFEGSENNFTVGFLDVDRLKHNAIVPGGVTYNYIDQIYGGLEPLSYQEIYIDYFEPEDRVKIILQRRNTYPDIDSDVHRKVEGDTRPDNVRCSGRETGVSTLPAYPIYMSWFIIREYDGISTSSLDGSALYIPYEAIPHENQDFREYLPDITNIIYQHETSFGGNPFLLSDEDFSSDTTVWISDADATLEPYVALTIHTGWKENIVDRNLLHYDSSHVYYYGASKLSDNDEDRMGRDYWLCTTSSGWAAIRFNEPKAIGSFKIKATNDLSACPHNFVFYGANINPVYSLAEKVKLLEGTFSQTQDMQAVVLSNSEYYKYYILDIQNTYGNAPIEIQEWEMMNSLGQSRKRYVSQLRLHPALYGDWQENFPKEISLQSSLNGVTWTTVLPWTYTYTPFIQHVAEYGYWQYYTFSNVVGAWSFRLLCRGNWGADDGRIIIGEWSMNELATEDYTYRILSGVSNDIKQVWAGESCGIDDIHSIFFAANDKINKISNNKLVDSQVLPVDYKDFNVI